MTDAAPEAPIEQSPSYPTSPPPPTLLLSPEEIAELITLKEAMVQRANDAVLRANDDLLNHRAGLDALHSASEHASKGGHVIVTLIQ